MRFKKLYVQDFCCFESFELSLDSQGLVLISGENKDTDAAANNGAGKSTITKALTWCLYGKTIDGERGDKIILNGRKKAFVGLDLRDSSGSLWKIQRERRKGSANLALIQPSGESFKASKDDIQSKIVDMVGLDFHAFKSTVLYGQNDSSRFADPKTRDSERKKMLHDILKTSVLEKCHKLVLNERKEIKTKIDEEEKKLLVVKTKLEGLDLENKIRYEKEYERTRRADILTCKKNAYDFKQIAVNEIKSTTEEKSFDFDKEILIHEREILLLKDSIDEKKGVEESLEDINKKLDHEVDVIKAALVNKLMEAKAKSDSLTDRIEELSGDKCPICTSDLTNGDPAIFKESLCVSRKNWRKSGKNISVSLKEVDVSIGKLKKRKSSYEDSIIKKEGFENRIDVCEALIDKYKSEKKSFEEKEEKTKDIAKKYVSFAKEELKKLKEIKLAKNPYTEERKTIEKKFKEYNLQKKKIKKVILEKSKELGYIQFWERGFSNQGLPSFILDSVMPFLAKRANVYLRVLADGDIKIDFSTQRQLKSKDEKKDEIEITWEIEGCKDYPPSGGQLKKIELATDFALMDLVATKEGGYVDLLMLDEILDGLDTEGSRRVVLLLKKLRKYRSSIFVISHLPEVSESFERSMSVIKEGGVSKLENVA